METDVAVAVMGMTGVGKSTFIKMITGDEEISIGHGLVSETSEVRGYAFRDGAINYTLIDTPGFDDTFLSDDDVTKKIVEWLDSSYRSGVRLNGLIYMHSIALPKMQGSAFQNLRMFRKLCGSDALKNVILATTFWDQVEPLTGQERERVLIEDPRFWGRMVQFGSRVLRTGSSRESALHILRQTAGNQKITLQVQQETVVIPEHRRLSYQIAPSFNTAANPGRTQWYLDNMMKREAESKKWSADLESLKRHALDQSLILEKVREDAEKERVRIEQQREERRKIYKSNRCHCKIVGRASCASCGRELSKVGKVFYHCCICGVRTYLHCSKCGNKCPEEDHPQMERIETYCAVM